MNHVTEVYGAGATIDSLYSELTQLEACYGEYLEQDGISEEVAMLKHSIEECRKGSLEAADCLREHGEEILADIKVKLEAASTDQARMVEESPTAATEATGRRAHEASRAAAIVSHSQEKLESAIDEIQPQHHEPKM